MSTPTVTINEAPSAQLVQAAAKQVVISDAKGRAITLARPGVLAQFRLIESVGPETAKNEVYMGMVLPLIFVTDIDGEPVFQPANKLQLEALIQRLGDEGVEAVHKGVAEHFGARDPEADKAALKK